jgi:Arc/MetJ family transcription regulator
VIKTRSTPGHRAPRHFEARKWALTVMVPRLQELDDELLAEAQRLTGTPEKPALVHQALGALVDCASTE